MHSGTTLRAALQSDVPAITRLLRRSWLVTWAPELPFEAVRAFAQHDPARLHAESAWSQMSIAICGEKLVGLFMVSENILQDLHVDPAQWGRGFGTLLLENAEQAIGRNFRIASLEVRGFNERAIRFYRHNGWTEKRRYPGTECGAPVENLEMTKIIE